MLNSFQFADDKRFTRPGRGITIFKYRMDRHQAQPVPSDGDVLYQESILQEDRKFINVINLHESLCNVIDEPLPTPGFCIRADAIAKVKI